MLASGALFFLARPQRYIYNPVFAIKSATFLLTIMASFWLRRRCKTLKHKEAEFSDKLLAASVLTGWILTALAGRWIAYSDYIFWPG
jgi:hypothetical protein